MDFHARNKMSIVSLMTMIWVNLGFVFDGDVIAVFQ